MSNKKVSVVIAAAGSCEYFIKGLKSIRAQSFKNYEIIVVDDGIALNVRKWIDTQKDIIVYESGRRGTSYARNIGIFNSSTEYIAFVDSDCIVQKNWLEKLVKGLDDNREYSGLGSGQIIPQDSTAFQRAVAEFITKWGFVVDYGRVVKPGTIKTVQHNASCNSIYKSSVLKEINGFVHGIKVGEDVELDYQILERGYRLGAIPDVPVAHYRAKDVKSFVRMMYRYGRAQGQLIRHYGFFRPVHYLPPLFYLFAFFSLQVLIFGYLNIFIAEVVIASLAMFVFVKFNVKMFLMCIIGGVSYLLGYPLGLLIRFDTTRGI